METARPGRPNEIRRSILRALMGCLLTVVWLTGCAKSIKQDENLAAQRGIEFARIVLVNKDFDQGYELLSDNGKRHISLAKFKETMIRLHPRFSHQRDGKGISTYAR
jgi:hypothetical protein